MKGFSILNILLSFLRSKFCEPGITYHWLDNQFCVRRDAAGLVGEARREESWVPSSPELQVVRGKQIILPDILTTESDSEAESDMEADPALDNKETDQLHSK